MEIDKVFNNDVDGVADNLFSAVKNSVSEVKVMQQRKAAENVQLVIQALKKIDSDIRNRFDGVTNAIEKRVASIKDGRDGINGKDGRDGKDGRPGKDGAVGPAGRDGLPGRNGVDGVNGVSVASASIDFDGSLIISLDNGSQINVGEVVAPDLAERIKVITNGGGTSQYVLDTLTSLQSQINTLIPSQTGNSGKYLTTNGTTTSWATISGGGAVNSVNGYTGTVVLAQTDISGTASLTTTQTLTNKTLTSPKINEILDANGNEILGLSTTASSTDFLTVKNGIGVGVPLHVYADGSSSNIGLHIQPKGTGLVTISDGADFDKGIRFRSVSSAASAITLIDAVSTAGRVVTLPDATTTLVGRNTTDTLTNKTLTSPTLTTPVLGTPASGDLANCTFPTLNQNTTGTASNVTGTVAVANGGTGATTASGARTNLGLVIGTDVLAPTGSAASLTSFPTFNQNTTGTASNVTGTVAIANGGTGLTSTPTNGQLDIGNGTGFTRATLTGTASQITVTNGSGSITLSLPSTINVNTSGSAASLSSTLAIASGGTGATTLAAASIVTYTGSETLTNKTLTNPSVNNYTEGVVTIGTVTTSNTIALTNGTVQTATLTASTACTFTMPTATAGKSFVLLLKQAASTGNGTATFTSVKWGTAGAPTITATAGKMDILTFIADGTNWYGSIAQGYTP